MATDQQPTLWKMPTEKVAAGIRQNVKGAEALTNDQLETLSTVFQLADRLCADGTSGGTHATAGLLQRAGIDSFLFYNLPKE
jgi:hypothetical protein